MKVVKNARVNEVLKVFFMTLEIVKVVIYEEEGCIGYESCERTYKQEGYIGY